jgi:DNA-directed RNA polymerase subunit RPC12/RpoP
MTEVKPVTVQGRDLRCQHCGHDRFLHKAMKLDRVGFGGLVLWEGFWGDSADTYVCGRCGFAHFFLPVPQEVLGQESRAPRDDTAEIRELLEASRELAPDTEAPPS